MSKYVRDDETDTQSGSLAASDSGVSRDDDKADDLTEPPDQDFVPPELHKD
ncbi:hypothetical protein KKH39_05205 [Patescibacteria group bacterium]|nr:hypothetical protein [Patescibacteria group bacterium]